MPRISEYVTGNYKVDSKVINSNVDSLDVNGDFVGIQRVNITVVEPAIFSEWIDPSGSPYASLEDLINDLNSFFFNVSGLDALIPENQRVDTFADLPSAAASNDEVWYVRQQTGVWLLGTRRQSGFYLSDGVDWNPTNDPLQYFVDDQLAFKDDADNTKTLQFQLDQIGTSQNRTATWQDKDGIVAYLDDTGVVVEDITADFQLNDTTTYKANQLIRLQNRSGSDWVISTTGADTVEGESSVIIFDGETFDLTITGTDFRL